MKDLRDSKWIWQNNLRDEVDQYVYFRRQLNPDKSVKSIKINISAADKYKLFINGEYIGTGPSPCTPKYQYYDSYCIEQTDRTKQVCFAIIAYNIGANTQMVTMQNQSIAGFIFEAEITYEDESIELCLSDENWKTIISPAYFKDYIKLGSSRISNWSGYKETFASEAEPENWKLPGYVDENWGNAVEVNNALECFENLIPREIPHLYNKTVYPVAIEQVDNYKGSVINAANLLVDNEECAIINAAKPGSFPAIVIDFGKEVVGYLEIDLKGGKGSNMSIWYGESLDLMRVDTLILNGGWQSYTPYHRRAFRYIKLSFNNSMDDIYVRRVKLSLTHYPYNGTGTFECSNEMLNKIWDTSVYTVKMGSQDHFEDSVWREGMQWLADARVMALVNYWVFGDDMLPAKSIRQFYRIQLSDGIIPAAGPQRMDGATIDFSEHFVIMNYEYYYYTGNTELIKEYYPQMKKLMERFEKIEDEKGFLTLDIEGKWGSFVDWAIIDKREQVTALSCLYYRVLNDFIKMSRLIGENDVVRYEQKSTRLKENINLYMFNNEKGLYVDCIAGNAQSQHYSQQTNMIAVYCGIVPENKVTSVIEKAYSEEGLEKIKGAFLLSFVIDTLFVNGYKKMAVDMVEDYWGEMIRRGATTWWETFDRSTPACTIPYLFSRNTATYLVEYIPVSHCHGWGAGPAYFMMKNILGIRPVKPGFSEIVFEPYTEGISYCKGTIPTPHGDIKVRWEVKADGTLDYEIQKPDAIILRQTI